MSETLLKKGRIPEEVLRELGRRDPKLKPWFARIGPLEYRPQRPLFRALCRAIIAQQVSNKAAASMIRQCFELCDAPGRPKPQDFDRLEDEALQGAGISRQKRRYLRALAEAWRKPPIKGMVFSRSGEEEIIQALTAVTGIGRWTAQMFLLFSLGRPDIFSGDDLALRAGLCRVDGRESIRPKEAELRAAVWAPYRSVASLYLWRISHWQDDSVASSKS